MSNPDYPQPQWDVAAYTAPPAKAARTRLILAQGKQRWAFRLMSGKATLPAAISHLRPADLQREAAAEMAEAHACIRWLDAHPPCPRCDGRGFLFLTLDRYALPVWCEECGRRYHAPPVGQGMNSAGAASGGAIGRGRARTSHGEEVGSHGEEADKEGRQGLLT